MTETKQKITLSLSFKSIPRRKPLKVLKCTMTWLNENSCRHTKEGVSSMAFPHQIHGPGQGPGGGKRPGIHASILGNDPDQA